MSTRANIIIKDSYGKQWFYRHSDGYPESVIPSLGRFMKLLEDGKIRRNVGQCAAWLIAIGMDEYDTSLEKLESNDGDHYSWKVGAYETTSGIHGDIDHLYLIDLDEVTLKEVPFNEWEKYENE